MKIEERSKEWWMAKALREGNSEVGAGVAMPTCEHLNFGADCRVGRLTDKEGGAVTGYTIDVKVKCKECGLPFRFLGLPHGYSFVEPSVSADGTELRAPIEPTFCFIRPTES